MQSKASLDQIRREYTHGGLRRKDLVADPISQFEMWLQQAIDAGLQDPTAMVVATVDADGQPSQRIVLLKDVNSQGFVFYTNLGSRKAQELAHNKRISLHFPWHALDRQVIVYGTAEKLDNLATLKYFSSRPKESQLAAWASAQSRQIKTRDLLMQQFAKMKAKFQQGEIPLPDFWGGYRVIPHQVEFWQGGEHRLHDRFMYQKDDVGHWLIERLMP